MAGLVDMRGFVGPIGDDIPSIFPIVAGVLLFIGTLAYVNNIVAEKNNLLEVRKAALSLSYVVTEKGRLDRSEFDTLCTTKIKPLGLSSQVNFLVTLKRFCEKIPISPTTQENAFYVGVEDGKPNTYAFCTSLNPAPSPLPTLLPQPPEAIVYSYPVAVPCPDVDSPTNGLGQVNIIAWRGRQ